MATCKLGEKGCWSDGVCRATSNCTEKVVTNADKIRAMTDEELAEWALHEAPNIGREYSHSLLGLIQWLKQPAEETK